MTRNHGDTRTLREEKDAKESRGGASFGAAGLVAVLAVLAACASAPKPAIPQPIPVAVPDNVPVFVVDGNPVETKTVHVVVDGVPIVDIGWRFTGTAPTDPAFHFPFDVNMKGRTTLFYEIVYTNLVGHTIRYIEGRSTMETALIGPSDGNQKKITPQVVQRVDLSESIERYDIAPDGLIRSDFYIYGARDGKRPYSVNTYTYYVEDLGKWFSVEYVRGGPD